MRAIVVLLITLLIRDPAPTWANKHHRIVGGNVTSITAVPYLASIQLQTHRYAYQHICGGAILNSEWITTAAHCIVTRQLAVRFGVSNLKKNEGKLCRVVKIVKHPQYDGTAVRNDIALLRIACRIHPSTHHRPIELATPNTQLSTGTMAQVSGWGLTLKPTDDHSILRSVRVPIFDPKDCAKIYSNLDERIMVCAGFAEGGRDSCQGDSGGPLIQNNRLIGIVSFGENCAEANKPGVYTRISSYHNWIRQTIK